MSLSSIKLPRPSARISVPFTVSREQKRELADYALSQRQGVGQFVREAVRQHIDMLRNGGRPSGGHTTERRSAQVNVKLTPAELKSLQSAAVLNGESTSGFVRRTVLAHVAADNNKQEA